MSLPEYFWAKVDKTDGCWLWTGTITSGYGRFGSATGTSTSYAKYGTSLAHRIAWIDINGPVPQGLELDHLCNARACVRPDHLEPVTHEENVRRAAERRGRCRNGHDYTPDNRVSQYGKPGERCLECRRKANRESVRRQRERQIPADGIVPWRVREWAWANGVPCALKGPLPKATVAAYLAATAAPYPLADTG